jgi:hypothetical protein
MQIQREQNRASFHGHLLAARATGAGGHVIAVEDTLPEAGHRDVAQRRR